MSEMSEPNIHDSNHLIVVGASTPLAPALEELSQMETFFIGRSNPHGLTNWQQGFSLEDMEGITATWQAIEEHATSWNDDPAHLVLLQGVSTQDWMKSIYVNMLSVGVFAESFAQLNRQRRAIGSIALLGSASAYLGGNIPYAGTKAALSGIMRGLNRTYGNETRTNIVVPGFFEGGMTAKWSEERLAEVASRTYAKRPATAREVARAILFCTMDEYTCGLVVNMTSGQVPIV